MSYILDALRRADAERQHGQVPGLNAAPALPVRSTTPMQGALRWWVLGLAVLAGVAAAGWWWGSRPAVAAAGQGDVVAALPAAAPAAVNGDSSRAPVPPTAPPPVPAAPVPAAAALPPTLPVVVSAAPAPAPASAIAAAAVAPPDASVAPPAPPPTPAADTPPKPLLLSALAPDQRRALPPLAVSGAVWSSSAASRFVMLDGQLVREGDTVAPGLVLERIHPKSAVLRWRDLRVELPL